MKKATLKMALAWALAVLMALSFTACAATAGGESTPPADPGTADGSGGDAGDDAGGEGTTLTMWTLDFENFYNPQSAMAEQFEAETGIKVKVEMIADYWNKAAASISSDTGPDIIYWMGRNLYPYYVGGKLATMPVDSMETKPDDYWDAAFTWWSKDGEYYGIPNDYNYEGFVMLVINKGLLEENGFSVPEEWITNGQPSSFDELIEFAQSVTVMDGNNISIPGLVGFNDDWNANRLIALIKQMGGDFVDNGAEQITFNTETGRAAMEYMYDAITNKGIDSYDLGLGLTQFVTNGRAMMALAAPHWAGKIVTEQPDMDWIALGLPAVVEGSDPYFYVDGGWGYAVLENSQNKDAAWQFVDFCSRPENDVNLILEGAFIPARKELKDSPILIDDPVGERFYPLSFDILEYGFACPTWVIDSGYVHDTLKEYMVKIYTGEMTIEEGLQAADDACNARTAELKATYEQ